MVDSKPFTVTVHPFPSPCRHSCAYEFPDNLPESCRNAVVFVGGLTDGPHTVPFVWESAKRLGAGSGPGFSVFEIRMTSSFSGFGFSSLRQDVADIAALVNYLRGIGKETIVLFGHSTGSQDCVEYADYARYPDNPRVDGFILQGPVSDREAIQTFVPPPRPEDVKESIALAAKLLADGQGDEYLPRAKCLFFNTPMTAYRLNSLASKGGDDDFFSSDLDDATVSSVWGRFEKPVLVLYSENDEFVPASVDKAALLKTWKAKSPHISPLSGLIPGGSHAVEEPSAQEWVAERVTEFLAGIGRAGGKAACQIM